MLTANVERNINKFSAGSVFSADFSNRNVAIDTGSTVECNLTAADIEDKRRTLRMRKSSLLRLNLEGIDRPSLKGAETLDEYKQAFGLVYNEYVNCGYVEPSENFKYQYSLYSLLPETYVFLFKQHLTVVATLSEIFDSPEHGLPMDDLYKAELDKLRSAGRSVVEISSFVTSKQFRMRNIMIYMCKAMFKYSRINGVDDICIMVNPKHASFYTRMFLFELFGTERFYEKVQAPAVALRVDMKTIEKRMQDTYSHFEYEEDLFRFFCRTNTTMDMFLLKEISHKKHKTPLEVLNFFRI